MKADPSRPVSSSKTNKGGAATRSIVSERSQPTVGQGFDADGIGGPPPRERYHPVLVVFGIVLATAVLWVFYSVLVVKTGAALAHLVRGWFKT